jgi:hypothetical protein
MNDELESVWEEAVVVCFKVLSQHSPGATNKIKRIFSRDSRCSGRDSNQRSPKYKSDALPPQSISSANAYRIHEDRDRIQYPKRYVLNKIRTTHNVQKHDMCIIVCGLTTNYITKAFQKQ